MADTKYLELRGRTYWYIRKIPEALRPYMQASHAGHTHFRWNLKTGDVRIAQQLREKVGPGFAAEIAAARQRSVGAPAAEIEAQAQWWRANWEEIGDYDLVVDNAERIGQQYGIHAAQRFYRRATGQAGTAIDKHLERWLAECPCAPKFAMERRAVIRSLAEWRGGLDAERIDKEMTKAFVDEVIAPKRQPATINKQLGILSTYWHWMMRQDHLAEAPIHWSKFRRKAAREENDTRERAFTEAEMIVLFTKRPMRPDLRDAALMSAHLGARLEEIACLQVRHVNLADMTIHIPGTKTTGAARTIPLHKALRPIVAGRMTGKAEETAWLFHELPERQPGDAMGRSTVLSKAFTRHRNAVGIEGRVDGKRRSLVNFHSFRRWFITEAERAGGQPWVFEAIVGHKRLGMSLGRYSGGPDVNRQMREVMDKVKLPASIPLESGGGPIGSSSDPA